MKQRDTQLLAQLFGHWADPPREVAPRSSPAVANLLSSLQDLLAPRPAAAAARG